MGASARRSGRSSPDHSTPRARRSLSPLPPARWPWGKGIRCTNSTEMQILTVDVGTGTQDVLLFDSERELENCFKLVLPSPTVVIADRIRAATAARKRLVLHGVTMGGGPSHWATMD